MSQSAVQTYFDSVSRQYADKSARAPWVWIRSREKNCVRTMLGSGAPGAALDLGCGSGFYAALLQALRPGSLTVIDRSPRMLAQVAGPVDVRLLADGERPFGVEKYDLITCCGMIEFCRRPEKVLKNIDRALVPGGRAIILLPRRNWAGFVYRAFHRFNLISPHLFDENIVMRLLRPTKLEMRKTAKVFPLSLVLELVKEPVG